MVIHLDLFLGLFHVVLQIPVELVHLCGRQTSLLRNCKNTVAIKHLRDLPLSLERLLEISVTAVALDHLAAFHHRLVIHFVFLALEFAVAVAIFSRQFVAITLFQAFRCV